MNTHAILLALVHLSLSRGPATVLGEIAMSVIDGPPAECNTPLHSWLYYNSGEKMNTREAVRHGPGVALHTFSASRFLSSAFTSSHYQLLAVMPDPRTNQKFL